MRSRAPRSRLLFVILALVIAVILFIGVRLVRADGPPKIGKLTMPAAWWEIVQDAARVNGISPYWVAAIMAIESRYNRFAINHRYKCYGLLQLQADVARGLGVTDPFDAVQNIRGGAYILGRLEKRYGGDKKRILKRYNPTDDGAYSREVLRAWRQAKRSESNAENGQISR
ncbi:MAG: lytic transglycosylase domain-containing protein [Deltaproteobacteria bacterium]|nr:MAG: lytic transglycosylase domain-containing protein [Deltaproteobacteria bacterium]